MSKKTKKYRTADRALTPEQVKLLIQEGEGLTVEFKERYTSRTDEDIVAFANARGNAAAWSARRREHRRRTLDQ